MSENPLWDKFQANYAIWALNNKVESDEAARILKDSAVEAICRTYFNNFYISINQSGFKRLFKLLCTCQIKRQRLVIWQNIDENNEKRDSLRPFNSQTIKDIFCHYSIPYNELAASRLLYAVKQEFVSYSLKQLAATKTKSANVIYKLSSCVEFIDGYFAIYNPSYEEVKPKKLLKAAFNILRHAESIIPSSVNAALSEIDQNSYFAIYSPYNTKYGIYQKQGIPVLTPVLTSVSFNPRPAVKLLPVQALYSISISNRLKSLLFKITGGDTDTVNALSRLFADIADPRKEQKRLSVIYTKQNRSVIQALLSQSFTVSNGVFSVNKLLTAKNKPLLLNYQHCGGAVMLIDDTLPSNSHISDFIALINGRRIRIELPSFPKQTFQNRMHFVCVTDNLTTVKSLRAAYDAGMVDLTPFEQACKFDTFSPDDINWLRTAFVLSGIRAKLSGKNKNGSSQEPSIQKNISNFFYACCTLSETDICERTELYDAYRNYYKAVHYCDPPESPVVFGKRFRELYPNIEYTVCRRDNRTPLCYKGLAIKPFSAPTENIAGLKFSALLKDITRNADEFFKPMCL